MLTTAVVDRLQQLHTNAELVERDLSTGVPFVNEQWIGANFTAPDDRTPDQINTLSKSTEYFNELKAADFLVIGAPVYNFGVPAALKAWVDMVVRAKEAFHYTPDGPEGLLTGKSAYVVLTSGGTKAGSDVDFAWPYLKHILGFIGIKDVSLIGSDLAGVDQQTADDKALSDIALLN